MNEIGAGASRGVGHSLEDENSPDGAECFPFSAIVGQETLKRALLLLAINPNIRGMLIRGPAGCGKTIATRGLTEVLPPIEMVKGCRFNCDPKSPGKFCVECKERYLRGNIETVTRNAPLIPFPLNASLDFLLGRMDTSRIEKEGLNALSVGIIGRANRGLVFLERANLLDQEILKTALKRLYRANNTLDTGGFTVTHPAKFNIIATMNTEEGPAPQFFLDKMDVILDVERISDVEQRIEVIKRVSEFDKDPQEFRARFREGQRRLIGRVSKAQESLPLTSIPTKVLETISGICKELEITEARTNIIRRVTLTNAVFERRIRASVEDFIEVASMTFPDSAKKQFIKEEELGELQEEKRILEIGYNYLILEERTDITFEIFRDTIATGVPGLLITNSFPDKVRKAHGLEDADIHWLSDSGDKTLSILSPKRLDFEITRTISKFIKENKEKGCVLMLDGFEYLVLENKFEKILKFVKKINDMAAMSNSTILVPVNLEAFKKEQATILKKEFDRVEMA